MDTPIIPPNVLAFFKVNFGAAVIGGWIGIALYGIALAQVYTYFKSYPNDALYIRLFVLSSWLATTSQVILACHAQYHYLIHNIFDPIASGENVWSLGASIAAHVIVATLVLSYFTVTVYRLASRKLKTRVIIVLIFAVACHLAFGTSVVVFIWRTALLRDISKLSRTNIMPMCISQVVADVLVSISLCVLLNERRKSNFRSTNNLLKTLMMYALNRCILTSALAMVNFLANVIAPFELWYIAVEFIITPVYLCSFLSSLNARHSLRAESLDSLDTRLTCDVDLGHR